MTPADWIMLNMMACLLVGSAFFSGSETAYFSLSPHQRLRFQRSTQLSARTIVQLLKETRSLLITLLLGNMTINVLYMVIGTVLLIRIEKAGIAGGWLLASLTVLQLIFLIMLGEVLPKQVAARLNGTWAIATALPLFLFHRAISPARVVANAFIITPLARLVAPRTRPTELSASELATMLQLSTRHGVIDSTEEQLLRQVLALSQSKVTNVMVPRVDMVAFDLNRPVAELFDLIRAQRHSHIPAYRGDMDHIEGIIFARQVLLSQPADHQALAKLVRQVRFVPEIQRLDRLLIQFRRTGTTIAIAVDEYGGTAGLITLEDVVEQMVGNIAGPHEAPEEDLIQQLSENAWRISAELTVDHWSELMRSARPLVGVHTVGGLVMALLGRLPAVGDMVQVGRVQLTVTEMESRRVAWLTVELLAEEDGVGNRSPEALGTRTPAAPAAARPTPASASKPAGKATWPPQPPESDTRKPS